MNKNNLTFLEIYGNISQDNTCYFGFSMLKICVSGVQFSEVALRKLLCYMTYDEIWKP